MGDPVALALASARAAWDADPYSSNTAAVAALAGWRSLVSSVSAVRQVLEAGLGQGSRGSGGLLCDANPAALVASPWTGLLADLWHAVRGSPDYPTAATPAPALPPGTLTTIQAPLFGLGMHVTGRRPEPAVKVGKPTVFGLEPMVFGL